MIFKKRSYRINIEILKVINVNETKERMSRNWCVHPKARQFEVCVVLLCKCIVIAEGLSLMDLEYIL